MGGPASSTTAEIYMQAYERTAITTALHPPKVWERFVAVVLMVVKIIYLVGPYFVSPSWRYVARCGIKRGAIICLSIRV